MKSHKVNSVPQENVVRQTARSQAGQLTGIGRLPGPMTDHVLTGTHGTGAERVYPGRVTWPGSVDVRKGKGGWSGNPASGGLRRS